MSSTLASARRKLVTPFPPARSIFLSRSASEENPPVMTSIADTRKSTATIAACPPFPRPLLSALFFPPFFFFLNFFVKSPWKNNPKRTGLRDLLVGATEDGGAIKFPRIGKLFIRTLHCHLYPNGAHTHLTKDKLRHGDAIRKRSDSSPATRKPEHSGRKGKFFCRRRVVSGAYLSRKRERPGTYTKNALLCIYRSSETYFIEHTRKRLRTF